MNNSFKDIFHTATGTTCSFFEMVFPKQRTAPDAARLYKELRAKKTIIESWEGDRNLYQIDIDVPEEQQKELALYASILDNITYCMDAHKEWNSPQCEWDNSALWAGIHRQMHYYLNGTCYIPDIDWHKRHTHKIDRRELILNLLPEADYYSPSLLNEQSLLLLNTKGRTDLELYILDAIYSFRLSGHEVNTYDDEMEENYATIELRNIYAERNIYLHPPQY